MKADLKKLYYALTIARCGSFSMAAEELHLAQPSLSRSIAALEDQWRIRIFERGRSGVTVTPIGKALLDEAEQLLASARTLEHNMKLRSEGRAGTITFGMAPLIASIMMADVLTFLANRHPHLQVAGTIKSLEELLDDIGNDRAEFAVFSETILPVDDSLSFDLLGEAPLNLVVRAEHPLTRLEMPDWQDIAAFPMVSSTWWRQTTLPLTPQMICDNCHVVKDVLLNSDVVWLTSAWVVQGELAAGTVREIKGSWQSKLPKSGIYIASAKNRLRSPAATILIRKLEALIAAIDRVPLAQSKTS